MSSLPDSPEPALPSESPRASRPSLRPPMPVAQDTWRERLRAAFFALVRDPNPILLKEFRATLRTPLFVRTLYVLTGLVALLVVAVGAVFSDQEYVSPAEVGQGVFQSFFTVIAFVICLFVPSYSATAITSERETKTYESLVLSDMSATRIILGKFFAYFGSTVLILIAVSPVISIAFLFGGVSPLGVIVAFISTLVLLALATSFGVAVSARLESTRMAILAAGLFLPPSFFLLLFDMLLRQEANGLWSVSTDEGPFWFALALPELLSQPSALVVLVLFPLAASASTVWFFLASAVVGIRHPGEDRSTPLKLWAAVTSPAVGLIIGGSHALLGSGNDVGGGVAMTLFATLAGAFIGMVFANEPPLPPRARKAPTLLSRMLAPIGPGAAGTTRFAMVVALTPPVITGTLFIAKAFATGASHLNLTPIFAAVLGGTSLALCVTTIAEGIRLWVGNGLVARLLTIILFTVLLLAPVSASFALQAANMSSSADLPWILSPIGLLGMAIRGSDRTAMASTEYVLPLLSAAFYAFIGLLSWVGIEVSARRARIRDAALRAGQTSSG